MDTQTKTRTRGRELLTKSEIERAKPTESVYRLPDGGGLYVEVHPNGSRFWRLRYLHPTKRNKRGERAEQMVGLGRYPDLSITKARAKAQTERETLADGVDPSEQRRLERRGKLFQDVAAEWLALQEKTLAPATLKRHKDVFTRWIYPTIGGQPVAALTDTQIIGVLQAIDKAGRHETAKRAHQRIMGVLQLAKSLKMVPENVAAGINRKTILARRPPTKHHAAIRDPADIGQLLRDIDAYEGSAITRYALKIAPYIFARPGELRQAEWREFTLIGPTPTWTLPPEKMKMRRAHIVPLARQVVALLTELHLFTGTKLRVFPALTGDSRCMSENTLNMAIRRMGYDNQTMTAHGFRGLANTRLRAGLERGAGKYRADRDWIEVQMSHGESDEVREAYNPNDAEKYLDERREMMTEWANYLDRLRKAKP